MLTSLPTKVLLLILDFVPIFSLKSPRHVCKAFNPQSLYHYPSTQAAVYNLSSGQRSVTVRADSSNPPSISSPSTVRPSPRADPVWKDPNEKQFYSRRLPIIKAIRQRYATGQASSLQEAAVIRSLASCMTSRTHQEASPLAATSANWTSWIFLIIKCKGNYIYRYGASSCAIVK
jgi:hypothetical protein